MEINRLKILNALDVCKPGLAKTAHIEQGQCFVFTTKRITTYNDTITISYPIASNIKGAIQAKQFHAFLDKLTQASVDFTKQENGNILVKAGRSRAGFAIDTEIKVPLINAKGLKWYRLPPDFVGALKRVVPAASNNSGEPLLTCLHVHKNGYIEATDRYRACRVQLNEQLPFESFMLPTDAIHPLSGIEGVNKVAVTDQWIHFKNDEKTRLSVRTMEGQYPNLNHLFSVETKGSFVFPPALLELLIRAEPFYKRSTASQQNIDIDIEKGRIRISAKTEDGTGWFEETRKTDLSDMCFSISPTLLRDILQVNAEVKISDKLLICENDDWAYICCYNKKD